MFLEDIVKGFRLIAVATTISLAAACGGNDSKSCPGEYIVTSYADANEIFYTDNKEEVFDADGNSLGFYRSDFLVEVIQNGSGLGDGVDNPGLYLHYDTRFQSEEIYFLQDVSIGAYGNQLIPWTQERPSVAVNPPVPQGSVVVFNDLGPEEDNFSDSVINRLLTKAYYADDRFTLPGNNEKRIDIYTGLQQSKNFQSPQQNVFFGCADVTIEEP